jgi:hypothetical protein
MYLMQLRMKVCGQLMLPETFTWTPTMFLAMIKEIEKICPEEGQFDAQNIDTDITTSDNTMQAITE